MGPLITWAPPPLRYMQLYLYSDSDPLADPAEVEEYIRVQVRGGRGKISNKIECDWVVRGDRGGRQRFLHQAFR